MCNVCEVQRICAGHYLVPIVHCVGLHVINGAGGDGRCGHHIDLHIIGIMEVMPQCLQLWEVCMRHRSFAPESFPFCGKPWRPCGLLPSALRDSGFYVEPAFWDANE